VYQNRFVNERGLLWVYNRVNGTYRELHPSVICCEKDMYAVKPEGKGKDQRLESIVLAQLDGDCATGVRSVISPLTGLPGLYVSSLVSFFVGLQYSRLPSMREYVTTIWERGIKERMRLAAINEGRMQSEIDAYERSTGNKIDVPAKTLVDTFRRDRLKLVVSEIPFLRSVFDTAKVVAETVIRVSWQVLRAPAGTGFILCDAPVVVVPSQGVRQVGFHVPGTVTYIPLARGHCLRLSRPYRRLKYRDVDVVTVALINLNIAANSDRFVMGPDKGELENAVALSGCAITNTIPRVTFKRLQETDRGSFDTAAINPRSYFYLPDGRTP